MYKKAAEEVEKEKGSSKEEEKKDEPAEGEVVDKKDKE